MKKIILILLFAIAAFANPQVKYNFFLTIAKYDCKVVRWNEDVYEGGLRYVFYAKVACDKVKELPLKIGGLKFLNISEDLLFGTVDYYYGEIKQ